jgi:hypothetical protein
VFVKGNLDVLHIPLQYLACLNQDLASCQDDLLLEQEVGRLKEKIAIADETQHTYCAIKELITERCDNGPSST